MSNQVQTIQKTDYNSGKVYFMVQGTSGSHQLKERLKQIWLPWVPVQITLMIEQFYQSEIKFQQEKGKIEGNKLVKMFK